MTKAILEFNLPEDRDDFALATKAKSLYFVLWDIDQKMRSIVKYHDDTDGQSIDAICDLRKHLYELMEDECISFDMVE